MRAGLWVLIVASLAVAGARHVSMADQPSACEAACYTPYWTCCRVEVCGPVYNVCRPPLNECLAKCSKDKTQSR